MTGEPVGRMTPILTEGRGREGPPIARPQGVHPDTLRVSRLIHLQWRRVRELLEEAAQLECQRQIIMPGERRLPGRPSVPSRRADCGACRPCRLRDQVREFLS